MEIRKLLCSESDIPQEELPMIANNAPALPSVTIMNPSFVPLTNGKPSKFLDIGEFTKYPLRVAARKLQMPVSTLTWKESTLGRPWPFRKLRKLEKEVAKILGKRDFTDSVLFQEEIQKIMKQRESELQHVYIRIS